MFINIEKTSVFGLENITTVDLGDEGVYYLCKDILKRIGASDKNVGVAFKSVDSKCKLKFAVERETLNLQSRTPYLFVNSKGLIQYLTVSRKPLAKMALERVSGYKMFNGHIKLETNFAVMLHKVFDGIATFKEQYKIGDYRVDFFFKDYNLIVEYDEPYHNQQMKKDEEREKWITQKTGVNIIRVKAGLEYQGIGKIFEEILKFRDKN